MLGEHRLKNVQHRAISIVFQPGGSRKARQGVEAATVGQKAESP